MKAMSMISRRSLMALAAAAALAACAPPDPNPLSRQARAELRLSEIVVSTEGAGLESGLARRYSSSLAPDLRAELTREFSDRVGGGSAKMLVDVSRFNVAGGTATAFGRDQSQLQGAVRIVDGNGALRATYTIQVLAGEAAESTSGALFGSVANSGRGYYRDLLEQFARDTREQVLGADLPGQRILRRVSN